MARQPPGELRGAQRDGAAQGGRQPPELAADAIGIDERSPAELIRLARRFASQVLWHDLDNRPAGWWALPEDGASGHVPEAGEPPWGGPTFFDGIGPGNAAGIAALTYAEVAGFAADPEAFPGERYDVLRRPHMALFLTAVRLMRHGQRALNGLTGRHLDYHLRDVLGLAPRPAQPDRAYVLFELAPGVRAAEAGAGLRLLAGRDAQQRDRVYRLDRMLVVNRARVARLSSSFVDREVIGVGDARGAITGTPEERILFLLSIALGHPQCGDPLPAFRGAPLSQPRLKALAQFVSFSRQALSMELFELRALLARKARRRDEAGDWKKINATLETAGRSKRGDQSWQLQPADPRDFHANLAAALGGAPDLGGLTEVETVEDLALHLDRDDVRNVIRTRLFLDVDRQFAPMIALKRAIDADWSVINNTLQNVGRRRRPDEPGWTLPIADPSAFAANLTAAMGPIDFTAAGPEAADVGDLDAYLARCAEVEAYFFLSAEEVAQLIATFDLDEATPSGASAWRHGYALLTQAHARKVRAEGAAALRALRESASSAGDGLRAELEAALGSLPPSPDNWMEALARYASADEIAVVRPALPPRRRGAPAPDWAQIDAIMEEVRRRRLRLPEPVAQKVHWRTLWAYADARAARIAEGETAPWRCFGVPGDADVDRAPTAIGWAIASPALALSTGRRAVTLTLGFHDDGGGVLVAPVDDHADTPQKTPFTVALSGAKGWFEPTSATFAQVDYARQPGVAPVDAATPLVALQIKLMLDEAAAAATPTPPSAEFGATPWPVLKLMLRQVRDAETGRFDTAYERFRSLRLARVHLAIDVGRFAGEGVPGLWPLVVETETGVADGKKPFEPFGAMPSQGTELALGHADLLNKRLTRIGLGLDWIGGPADLATHYTHYTPRNFSAQLSLVDGGVRTSSLGDPAPLFAGNDTAAPVRIERPTLDAAPLDRVTSPLAAEVSDWRRYLTLRLSGTDFGHHAYPALATGKSIALANELRKGTDVAAAAYTVNPPYTPKLKRLALDFSAVHEIDVARYDRTSAVDRLFHAHPFGIEEAASGRDDWTLLPTYDEEGALYVGLAGVEAPQSLSLLFAGAGSAGAEERAGALSWSYLDAGGWSAFAEPPEDETEGLTRGGLVRFALPAAEPDTRMPAGFYWLRATMAEGAVNACDLVDVHAQAASAHYVDDGTTPEHYQAPLPAGTIRALGDLAPGIARVTQPYPSDEGRGTESPSAFRVRASERLRHKGRALTLWDYERLVLDHFPAVHTVKCIPATLVDGAPGAVRLVVIPDVRGQARADPFTPRAPARLLDEIAAHLTKLAPSSARIEVGHPVFPRVRVRLGVRFRPGGDEAYDRRRLGDHLNRYLAPWAFDEGADIAIGQRIDATSIVAFVDQLAFVDFVGGCRLFISNDNGQTFHIGADDGSSVEAPREDGILAPAARHEIDVIGDDLFEPEQFIGIGYMKLELDFVIA